MSDGRLAQARAEAERRYPHHGEDIGDAYGYGHFMDGWLAADAHPQPHTITLAQSEAILEAGRTGRYEDHEAALRAAGIEVEDDDE